MKNIWKKKKIIFNLIPVTSEKDYFIFFPDFVNMANIKLSSSSEGGRGQMLTKENILRCLFVFDINLSIIMTWFNSGVSTDSGATGIAIFCRFHIGGRRMKISGANFS